PLVLFLHASVSLRHLHSFPTRRSSDLDLEPVRGRGRRAHPLRVPVRAGVAVDGVGGRAIFAAELDAVGADPPPRAYWHTQWMGTDRKSTRLNSSHVEISYAVFCLKKKT